MSEELNIPAALLDILKKAVVSNEKPVDTNPQGGRHIKLQIADDTHVKEKFGR